MPAPRGHDVGLEEDAVDGDVHLGDLEARRALHPVDDVLPHGLCGSGMETPYSATRSISMADWRSPTSTVTLGVVRRLPLRRATADKRRKVAKLVFVTLTGGRDQWIVSATGSGPVTRSTHVYRPGGGAHLDTIGWLELCYQALGVGDGLPDQERRRMAEHTLLERTGQPIDILGIGAAEAAIDLVVRYGQAGELDQVILLWEQAETLGPEIQALGDVGTRRATLCAKQLVADVVAVIERRPGPESEDTQTV